MQSIIIKTETQMQILGRALSWYVEKLAQKYGEVAVDELKPEGEVLILFSDMPLVTGEIIDEIISRHIKNVNALTAVGSVYLVNAKLFLDSLGDMTIRELSTQSLEAALQSLKQSRCKYTEQDSLEDMRLWHINSPVKLAQAISIMRREINKRHMENGCVLIDPNNTYIGPEVSIGGGCVIYPNCYLEGETKIGWGCTIGPNVTLKNMLVGDNAEISYSVLLDSEIGGKTTVGPFAYIRPHSIVGENCKIGDFVEIKNAVIGNNTKASHLTYIGDADVGEEVNFGCGTVVVNYDGKSKHRSTIEDNTFIGCNTNLISPVIVKTGAYIAAGSTITEDVPEKALGIARARQINKHDWHKK